MLPPESVGGVRDLATVTPLVVIGAGRAALALVSRLPEAQLAGCLVLDSGGEWLGAWAARLRRCGAEHVRSPCTGGPLANPLALGAFASTRGRTAELLPSSARAVPVPSAQLCADFLAHALPSSPAARARLRKATVTGLSLLEPEERARLRLPAGGLRVHLSDGGSLVAAQVVLSCAHTQPAPLPPALAAGGPSSSLLQGPAACDADAVTLQGARVAVVGGGTSAATLALCALHRGATQVTLLARSSLRKREQDVESSWMGAASLRAFQALTEPLERLAAARAARGGGSVNARTWRALRAALKLGTLRIEERCAVSHAAHDGAAWTLSLRDLSVSVEANAGEAGQSQAGTALANVEAKVLWCACGTGCDAAHDPVLRELLAPGSAAPARVLGGYPVLDGGCRWPGAPLYCVGAYATLSVGPAAPLLGGHRLAAEAVLPALLSDGAAAAAGQLPYDHPAGALPLHMLYDAEEDMAMSGPFDALPGGPLKQAVPAGASPGLVDVSDLSPLLARINLASYAWHDAGADEDEAGTLSDAALLLSVTAQLPERCTQPLRCAFAASSVDVWAIAERAAYRLHLPKLYRGVTPKQCTARLSRDGTRLLVTLRKRESTPWRYLKG